MGLNSNSTGQKTVFLSIVGGKIKQPSEEGTPGAERRDWETQDGKSGTKWEISHDSIEGNIVGLDYKDGDYGTSLIVKLQDGNDLFSLQFSVGNRYYDDFAKKIKSLDLTKRVKLAPYDFEAENNGKMKKIVGIAVYQDGEKITSYYYDGKKNINKMPKVDEKEKEELGKDYWKIYFVKVGVFLRKEIEGIKVPEMQPITTPEIESAPEEDDDLPF